MQTLIATASSGFALGLGLIFVIGAQNAFVLRQGLRREHLVAVCLTCATSDALLIAAGVAGQGILLERLPWFEPLMRYGGAIFLLGYGMLNLRAAWQGGRALAASNTGSRRLMPTLLATLALTWLNPHVYLDTVVLLGSVSAQFPCPWVFGMGAMTASFVFFFGLGFGARALAPLFALPLAWRVLDALIALVMFMIAVGLVL